MMTVCLATNDEMFMKHKILPKLGENPLKLRHILTDPIPPPSSFLHSSLPQLNAEWRCRCCLARLVAKLSGAVERRRRAEGTKFSRRREEREEGQEM